jgi:tetratricopeptide (TPR) repeat protein
MSLTADARKRVTILIVGAVVLLLSGASLALYREWHIHQWYLNDRKVGLEAAANGQDVNAINDLYPYLSRYPDDIDALIAYAKSRQKVSMPKSEHLRRTVDALRNVLRLDPSRTEQRRTLMEIYNDVGMFTEANDQASALLDRLPNDKEGLTVKTHALLVLHDYDQSLQTAETALKLDPDNVTVQLDRLRDMYQLGDTPDKILGAASDLVKAHPNDQAALLVQGFSFELTGDPTDAKSSYHSAAMAPLKDKTTAMTLVQHLNAWNLWQESFAILNKLVDSGDTDAEVALLRRYWEIGDFNDLLKLHAKAANVLTDTESLALYADALRSVGKSDEASATLATLAQRPDDNIAAAWLAIERRPDQIAAGRSYFKDVRTACTIALQDTPNDPYLLYYDGIAAAAMAETDVAIDEWSKAASDNRTWAMPLVQESQELLLKGKIDQASFAADQARQRAPFSTTVALAEATVLFAQVDSGNTDNLAALKSLIGQIQKHSPGEENSLRMSAALYARDGDLDTAKAIAQSLIDRNPPVSANTLLALASVSRKWKLGLETECLDHLDQHYGRTPDSVMSRAMDDAAAGHAAAGKQLLEDAVQSASADQQPGYRIALARYLEVNGDPDATQNWSALGDEYPNDAAVQRAVLGSLAAYQDRAFYDRTISRVHDLLGSDSILWKMARARRLLDNPNDPKSVAEATVLLEDVTQREPDSAPAKLLLGLARARVGDLSEAKALLTEAQKLKPDSALMAIDLARLLQYTGDYDGAAQQLEGVANGKAANLQDKLGAAQLLSEQGDVDAAVKILEPITDSSSPPGRQLLLASLYCRQKEYDRSMEVCQRLLNKKPLDPGVVLLAAQLDMLTQNRPAAYLVLQKLDQTALNQGEKDLIAANFYYEFSDHAKALDLYRAATQLIPDNAVAWFGVIGCDMTLGKPADAMAAVDQALKVKQLSDNPRLLALQDDAILIKTAGDGPVFVQLLQMLVKDPGAGDAPATTLRALEELVASDYTPDVMMQKLQSLADSLPHFLPAQTVLIQTELKLGRAVDAAQTAARAAHDFPTDSLPAQLGVMAYAAQGRWADALNMAQMWRSRLIGDVRAVDVQIAEIQIRAGDPAAALQTLAPYLTPDGLKADPSGQTAEVQAQALLAQGDADGASGVIWDEGIRHPITQMQLIDQVASGFPEPQAVAWLQRMDKLLAGQPNSGQVQLQLASAWDTLAQRTSNPDYAKASSDLISKLEQDPTVSANAYLIEAMTHEERGQAPQAEAAYRQALAKGNLLTAKNNLAMLLAKEGKFKEAENLAKECVAADPKDANFYDTLAEVSELGKQTSEALDAMRTALLLEPDNAQWRVNLAQMQLAAGRREDAKATIGEIDAMTPGASGMPLNYQKRLQSLRDQLNSGTAASLP